MSHRNILRTLLVLIAATQPARAADETTPVPRDVLDALNLGFEKGTEGWKTMGPGYDIGVVDGGAKEGARSARLLFQDAGQSAVFRRTFPVAAAQGKRLRLSGWLKAAEVTGAGSLWMRVDAADGTKVFDNMPDRALKGTADWTRGEVTLMVPPDATNVEFGVMLGGGGTLWADGLTFDLLPPPPPPGRATVAGTVRGADGAPLPGARVSLVKRGDDAPAATTSSDAKGHFALEVLEGDYALTASAGSSAAYEPPGAVTVGAPERAVALQGGSAVVKGRVVDGDGAPVPGASVVVARHSDDEGDLFAATTGADGRFSVAVVRAEGYSVLFHDPAFFVTEEAEVEGAGGEVEVVAHRRQPAPEPVVAWLAKSAVALASTDPGASIDDMAGLDAIVGDASVVGIGEATHGTREFFQLKHRLLRYLVEKRGFTTFAIEASYPEALDVDRYVTTGEGKPEELVGALGFWTWDTQEVVDLVSWMRTYNASHETKVRFTGVDVQQPASAVERGVAFLARVAPPLAASSRETLAPLAAKDAMRTYAGTPPDAKAAIRASLEKALAELDANRDAWSKATSPDQWRVARECFRVVQQSEAALGKGMMGFALRDQAMGENVLALAAEGKVLFWAHNDHVQRAAPPMSGSRASGVILAGKLGKRYVAIGQLFNRGGFRAIAQSGKDSGKLVEHSLGAAPVENVEAALARAELPRLAIDLRRAPADSVAARWLAAPHPMRSIGAVFGSEARVTRPGTLPELFDALLFVETATPSRPIVRE